MPHGVWKANRGWTLKADLGCKAGAFVDMSGSRRPSGGTEKLEIKRSGSQPSGKGSVEYFTGTVRIAPLFQAEATARVFIASVTFEPGARTARHTHPLGQTLIVTAACGLAQREGGPIEEIRPGDVVWFPPGEKHWHGATANTGMTHIAIVEQLEGKKPTGWRKSATNNIWADKGPFCRYDRTAKGLDGQGGGSLYVQTKPAIAFL